MDNQQLLQQVTAKAQTWLGEGYDAETRAEVKRMFEADDKTELIESCVSYTHKTQPTILRG